MSADRKADEKLGKAIEEYLEAQGHTDGLLIEWLLVTAQHIPLDDGGSATGVGVYVDSDQAIYRSIGLAHYAVKVVESEIGES